MWWPFKRKAKSSPKLSIAIEYDREQDDIMVTVDWPTGLPDPERMQIAKGFATLLGIVHDGTMFSAAQEAVGVYGDRHGERDTARAILYVFNRVAGGANQSDAVVPATEAFRVRNR